ncbi:DUF362 domain-containing protein [Nanoarchaeota archaeon]
MSDVNFLDIGRMDELDKCLEPLIKGVFSEGEKIAIKIHFGEPGNPHYISPEYTKKVVDLLKRLGVKPFLFDSLVNYNSPRAEVDTHIKAVGEHGYTEEAMGCPIVVSNEFTPIKTDHLTVQVCKPLAEADGMLVMSHVKGHPCGGFGAAIKNLGMGGVTKQSKKDQHEGSKPNLDIDKCTGCGTCVEKCPAKAIKLENEKSVFDYKKCFGCSICQYVCPYDALSPRNAFFDTLLAEAAQAVLKAVKKSYFVNIINEVAKLCDCFGHPSEIIAKDVGVVFSDDIIAADKASFDLVVEKEGEDVFEKHNNKSPMHQIKEGERLGLGSTDYNLIKC